MRGALNRPRPANREELQQLVQHHEQKRQDRRPRPDQRERLMEFRHKTRHFRW